MSIESLNAAAAIPQYRPNEQITNFLYILWLSRPDLQSVFDIQTHEGQVAYCGWAKDSVRREYGVEPKFYAATRIDPNGRPMRSSDFLKALKRFLPQRSSGTVGDVGATLIGYAEGVLGMGEHVRMTAEALSRTAVPFGVLNVAAATKTPELASHLPAVDRARFRTNIFHVNADQMLHAYCRLGADFFRNRYNIGFWAWELAKCPANWIPVLEMIDEIWAPSRFIQTCFQAATNKPVIHMPLCVELPAFETRRRSYFGLPQEDYLFLYTFDFLSYIDRKNPFAAIRAFKKAFPGGDERAGLVLKVMNGDPDAQKWREMLELIDQDRRIWVVNEVMTRGDVLALTEACNCFLSLHRSEGFGRGPAEAMYLGKPVIATNYSGNTDFTRPDTSLLVDYRLTPVEPGQYVFEESQVWAEVDVDHAARQMRRAFEAAPDVKSIAERGQQVIRGEFSYEIVGRNMTRRLLELGLV